MPDLIYNRTITVLRMEDVKDAVNGRRQGEVAVKSDVACSIQLAADRSAATRVSPGPTDTNDAVPVWNIFIPAGSATLGDIRKADKVVDDLGVAYVVEAPYWNILGYRLSVRLYHP